jgi:hypothetical protein
MGIPADEPTKRSRGMAHRIFDQLWKDGWVTRSEAYTWMQTKMGLTADEAHIGRFTREQCAELIRLVWDYLGETGNPLPHEWR